MNPDSITKVSTPLSISREWLDIVAEGKQAVAVLAGYLDKDAVLCKICDERRCRVRAAANQGRYGLHVHNRLLVEISH